MKKLVFAFCAMLLMGLAIPTASAATITLFEYGFNLDGAYPNPPGVSLVAFDTGTGLGTITATITGAGSHSFTSYFDHEIDEAINTFFNEYGATGGAPGAGQSWEIDEPGFVFGDIYDNFMAGTLDGTNAVPAGSEDDVSMAIDWDFVLGSNEIAILRFFLADSLPVGSAPPAFFLQQYDPESEASVYLYSDLNIRQGGEPPIPEPGTLVLVLSGLGLAVAARFRKSF